MLRHSIVMLLVVSLFSASAVAQAPSSGSAVLMLRVHDAAGAPIAGATVRLPEFGLESKTGDDGSAVFRQLPAAAFRVVVSADGFYPNESRQPGLIPGEQATLPVELAARAVVSEQIVVTGSGTEALIQDAPIQTQLITPALVEQQVKTTLAEAFQATIAGVRVEMNCQNCGFMQLRMNGLEGPYTQILEDGLPTYSGVTAVYGLEQIPAGMVDQIEVVKGGNSALYGPGAVAGVINLIRREPRENRLRLDVLSGWHHGRPEQQAGAAAQLVNLPGAFSGDFYYRGSNRTPVDRDRDGFTELGKRRLNSGGFGLFRRFLDGRAKLTTNGFISDEFRRGGDQLNLPPEQTWITEQAGSRRYSATAGWNHALTPTTFYNIRASHAYYHRNTYYGSGMDPNAYGGTRNPLWIGDAQVAHQAGRHSILAGYQFAWDYVEDNAPAYQRSTGGSFSNSGFYLQDEWRATSAFTVIAGGRFDKSNQVDRWIASPRVGLKAGLSKNLVWRATLSTGFRAPAIFDEDLHIAQVGGEGFVMQNAPGLGPEKSRSFTTGLQQFGSVRGRRYEIGINGFHTSLRDAFTLVEDESHDLTFRRLLRINGNGARVAGLDADGWLQLTQRLGLRAGFTLQRARWNQPEEQFGARRFFRAPNTYGFLTFDWDLPGRLDWTGTADYTGSMLVPHYAGYIPEDRLERSRRFLVFNTVVSRTFLLKDRSQVRLYFNLQNIGDAYQRDLDRGPSRDSAYVYGPAEMRRAVVGLTIDF